MASALSTEDLVGDLCERFPEDADDLRDALEELRKQKLGTVGRIARLSDNQWQRLGLPLGIETLIREEVAAAISQPEAPLAAPPTAATASAAAASSSAAFAAVAEASSSMDRAHALAATYDELDTGLDEGSDDGALPLEPFDYEAARQRDGLYQRRGGSGGGQRREVAPRQNAAPSRAARGEGGILSPVEFTPPDDLEDLWIQLLEDTLPPDKRQALQDSWVATDDAQDKYMMYLEYSSYLRKPEVTDEEKEARRKQLEPLMRELGVPLDEEESEGGVIFWWLVIAFVVLVAGSVYYYYTKPEDLPPDMQMTL